LKLAVIPARGGSNRIPRKNIKNFRGKPIIAWSIEAALKSGCFDCVAVSTDDEEIADIARRYGAKVPFLRPAELSDDYTGTIPVIAHAIDWYRQHGEKPDEVCCIYATAPFISHEQILLGLKLLQEGDWSYVFSATTFASPIMRAFEKKADNGLKMFFPVVFQTRSQDLTEAMHDAGQIYWGRSDAWRENKKIFDSWSTVIRLPRWQVQDIDTLEDWTMAELLHVLIEQHKTTDNTVWHMYSRRLKICCFE